jgi:mRNA interferase MazF
MSLPVQRGDVYRANLNPKEGSEQDGVRPVLVVSRNSINTNSSVVVIVPFTDAANKKRDYPSHVRFKAGTAGLTMDSIALCEQVRAISKTRLLVTLGSLSRAEMTSIEAALKITLDLP